MLRLWMVSYARPTRLGGAAALSFVAHAIMISAWVHSTRPLDSMPTEGLANRLYYLPPPDRVITGRGQRETIRYITLAAGTGAGPGPASIDVRKAVSLPEPTRDPGERAPDTTATLPVVGDPKADSVFTILEVDSAAVRSQSSAAPAYPLDLLSKRIEGSVNARYVVDTTGFADTASFTVLRATNEGFVRAVREALPYMRFTSAKIGTQKVRQAVEQSFSFRITPNPPVATPKP